MSEPLIVHSHFEDIAQLAEGLADRVDEGQLILYGPTNYEEGDRVAFTLMLLDETVVVEGLAKVQSTIDGGEERDPSIRYDVVLGELDLDDRSEIMFERLYMATQGDGSRSTAAEIEEAAAPEPAEDEAADEEADVSEADDVEAEAADAADADAADAGEGEDAADEAAPEAEAEAEAEADAAEAEAAEADDAQEAAGGGDGDSEDDGDEGDASPAVEPEAYSVTDGEFVGEAPDDGEAQAESADADSDVDDADVDVDADADGGDSYDDDYGFDSDTDDAPGGIEGAVVVDGGRARSPKLRRPPRRSP